MTVPKKDGRTHNQSWRASELPQWVGPSSFSFSGNDPAPFDGHRWLPLSKETEILRTPVKDATFDAFGPSWHSWALAAQTHCSFLEHVEKGELWKYKFNIWDYHYTRLSINFYRL